MAGGRRTDESLYLTIVAHRHGDNYYLNRTERGALLALYSYVTENWGVEEVGRRKNPATGQPYGDIEQYDESTAIEIYFEIAADEDWALTQETVDD